MISCLAVNWSLVSHLGLLKLTLNFIDAQSSKALFSYLLQPFAHGSPAHRRFCRGIIKYTDTAELKFPPVRNILFFNIEKGTLIKK